MASTDGSETGCGALPGSAELAEGQVQRLGVDQAERGGIPERGRAAVAQDHLVAVRSREELTNPVAHPADQILDRSLPV